MPVGTMENAIKELTEKIAELTAQQSVLATQIALSNQAASFHKDSLDSAHKQLRDHNGKINDLIAAESQNKKARGAVWLAAFSLAGMFILSAYDSFHTRIESAIKLKTISTTHERK